MEQKQQEEHGGTGVESSVEMGRSCGGRAHATSMWVVRIGKCVFGDRRPDGADTFKTVAEGPWSRAAFFAALF